MSLQRAIVVVVAWLCLVELSRGRSQSYSISPQYFGGDFRDNQFEEIPVERTTSSNDRKSSKSSTSSTVYTAFSSNRRRACGLYVWDAPSALLSRWCNHLLQDCIYEGRGGRKYVQIVPGSILQLLYPCNRYSTDQCIICGGKFVDHLELWWAPNLYRPFDRWLDESNKKGVVWFERNDQNSADGKGARKVKKGEQQASRKSHGHLDHQMSGSQRSPRFLYHRSYVRDTDQLPAMEARRKKGTKVDKEQSAQHLQKPIEWRRVSPFHVPYSVDYSVPSFEKKRRLTEGLRRWVRGIVLNTLDRTIYLESVNQMDWEINGAKGAKVES